MLNSFEARLVDLLADRLNGVSVIGEVRRPRTGGSPPSASQARVTVTLVSAGPMRELGDDRPEVLGQRGAFTLRTTLYLEGAARIALELSQTSGGTAAAQRGILLQAIDHVLLALHDPEVRDGRAFGDSPDQGFALDGFRLEGVSPVLESDAGDGGDDGDVEHRAECRYVFAGRFWPVEDPAEGDLITEPIPTRIALLPAGVAENLSIRAGDDDLAIPVKLDVRTLHGATRRLHARLLGASPPGQLIGDAAGVPAGTVAYDAGTGDDPPDIYRVIYRPPASLDGTARVRVELALARAEGPPVVIDTLEIEVAGA